MIQQYEAYEIEWETDGADVDLPTEVTVEADSPSEVGNVLSDSTGWLVLSYRVRKPDAT